MNNNSNKKGAADSSNLESAGVNDSHAIERFENLVLELNRAIFQFGLFLPPLIMWEKVFGLLTVEEMKYGTDLLYVLYNHVYFPQHLFSNFYISSDQWESIKKSLDEEANKTNPDTNDKILKELFNHDFKMGDQPIYVQSMYYNKQVSGLGEYLRIYKDYLNNLRFVLSAVAWEKYKFRIPEGFDFVKKISVKYDAKKLEQVAVFLIDNGCINSDSKNDFIALFDNAFMKKSSLRIKWTKEGDNGKTNIAFLKELFVVLGVDMEDKKEREKIQDLFYGNDEEELSIRSQRSRPNRSNELELFSSKLQKILNLPTP